MKPEHAFADVKIRYGERTVELRCLVDTCASRSIISKKLSEKLGAFTPLEKPYELRTAEREGKIKVIGFCNVDVVFQGIEVPGGARFEVAENLREETDLVIGRPEIDAWDIIFTPEGPKPRKVPIEFEII